MSALAFSVTFAHGSNERSTDLEVLSHFHAHTLISGLSSLHSTRPVEQLQRARSFACPALAQAVCSFYPCSGLGFRVYGLSVRRFRV
jgi:hypothetical protein